MAVRTILTEPNNFLRKVSEPVERVGKDEKLLMDDMLETMYAANGIGLAAIQIGVPKRVIVIDLSKDGEKKTPLYFVNPEIITKSKNDISEMFNRHTIDELKYVSVEQKESHWATDLTVKKLFEMFSSSKNM